MTVGQRIKRAREAAGMTQEQLGKFCNSTKQTIYKYETGVVTNIPTNKLEQIAKALNVTPQYLTGWQMRLDLFPDEKSVTTWIPVLGRIPAGTPIEAIEEVVDREDIPSALARKGEHFGLRIVGDSMSPVYLDGDTIIVRKQSDCESGEDCVVMINGDDATFKRVIKNENGILLRPLNPDYDVMMFSNDDIEKLPVRIVGIAVEVRRKIGK